MITVRTTKTRCSWSCHPSAVRRPPSSHCRHDHHLHYHQGFTAFFGVLPSQYMYHHWPVSLFSFPPFAPSVSFPGLHRLLLNFTIIGVPSINFLFNLIWLLKYGVSYEQAAFLGDAAASIWGAMLGMAAILVVDLVLVPFAMPFHGQALIFQMLYLWSRTQGPEVNVSLFGLITLKALYLPFALFFVDLVQGANPAHGIQGMLAGHLVWFLQNVVQARWVNEVPAWLRRARWVDMLDNLGKGRAPTGTATGRAGSGVRVVDRGARSGAGTGTGTSAAPDGVRPSTSSAGFRAFSGRGHKLT